MFFFFSSLERQIHGGLAWVVPETLGRKLFYHDEFFRRQPENLERGKAIDQFVVDTTLATTCPGCKAGTGGEKIPARCWDVLAAQPLEYLPR